MKGFKKALVAFGALFSLLLIYGMIAAPPMPKSSPAALAPSPAAEHPLKMLAKEVTNSNEIELTSQVEAPETYLVGVRIRRAPLMGGQSDWNSVASETFRYCQKLLANPAVARLHFTYYSPENNNVDWAHIWVDPRKLPANWEDSYLLFFSKVQVDASSVTSSKWLTDFYAKYETARPN